MRAAASFKAQLGLTLVEVIAFLIVVGVGVSALLPMFRNVLPRSTDSSQIIQATHLAQSRMELILGQRAAAGFSGVNDPCQAASPAACALASGYSLTVIGMPTTTAWPALTDTSRFRMVTVRVTGPDGNLLSQVDAIVGNY